MVDRYWADPFRREKLKAVHRERERAKRADPKKNAVILARLREKRQTNPKWRERTLAAVNARRKRFIGRNLAITAKKRAAARGMACTITPEWVQSLWEFLPECAYCGRALTVRSGQHGSDSVTLDRKDTTKGYTRENTVLACFRCNTLKRDATLGELEALVTNMRRVCT